MNIFLSGEDDTDCHWPPQIHLWREQLLQLSNRVLFLFLSVIVFFCKHWSSLFFFSHGGTFLIINLILQPMLQTCNFDQGYFVFRPNFFRWTCPFSFPQAPNGKLRWKNIICLPASYLSSQVNTCSAMLFYHFYFPSSRWRFGRRVWGVSFDSAGIFLIVFGFMSQLLQ